METASTTTSNGPVPSSRAVEIEPLRFCADDAIARYGVAAGIRRVASCATVVCNVIAADVARATEAVDALDVVDITHTNHTNHADTDIAPASVEQASEQASGPGTARTLRGAIGDTGIVRSNSWRYGDRSGVMRMAMRVEAQQRSVVPAEQARQADVAPPHGRTMSRPGPTPLAHFSPEAGQWLLGRPPPYVGMSAQMHADVMSGSLENCTLNQMNLLERRDIGHVFRVEPRDGTAARTTTRFDTDMLLSSNGRTARYLLTMEVRNEAIAHGKKHFGEGNFRLYRVNAIGLPAISYRSHVYCCLLSGGNAHLEQHERHAFIRGDVYLDIARLDLSRVRRERVDERLSCCKVA